MFNKILPTTGVKPRTSDIEIDRSTNWATTTSRGKILIWLSFVNEIGRVEWKYFLCNVVNLIYQMPTQI